MLVKPSLWRRAGRALALRAFCYLENNNDADIAANGEAGFIDQVFGYYRRRDAAAALVAFDVGANEGEYVDTLLQASAASGCGLQVHAFEPVTNSFMALAKRFSATGNVVLNRQAASDRAGRGQIFVDPLSPRLASMQTRDLAGYRPQAESIETVRLDSYIAGKKLTHLHFLKLDVEGHELAVLRGLGDYLDPEFIDFCQFEYGGTSLSAGVTLAQFYRLFEEKGFLIGKLMRHGVELRAYQAWMDNFHYSNYVAVSRRIAATLS